MPKRYKRFVDDAVRKNYISFFCMVQESLIAVTRDERYNNSNYYYLFLKMLEYDLDGQPVTLEQMLDFMVSPASKSTKLRLIDQAKRDGHILAFRKSDLEEPETLADSSAKKAFFLSESLKTELMSRLDELIVENMKFVNFRVRTAPV